MNEMLKDFMQRRSAVHAAGLAAIDRGEVEPYDAVPAQVLDPKQAWDEATASLAHFGMHERIAAPADWPQLVATADAAVALPFAAGHFPQSVRDLHRLARAVQPAELVTESAAPIQIEGIETWVRSVESRRAVSEVLLAVGVLRVARQFDRAEKLLTKIEKGLPAASKPAVANERAANLWSCGRRAAAAKILASLPECAPVLFNRGMTALFLGDNAAARRELSKAVAQIAESSGWHHLGRLYLALAQS
jgi:tetratricopeptide (TPR) repeat protein